MYAQLPFEGRPGVLSASYRDIMSSPGFQVGNICLEPNGEIKILNTDGKDKKTLDYAHLGHFALQWMIRNAEKEYQGDQESIKNALSTDHKIPLIIALGGGNVTKMEFDLAVLNGIVCDWLVIDVKINMNGTGFNSGPLASFLSKAHAHKSSLNNVIAPGFTSSITARRLSGHNAWFVRIRRIHVAPP